MNDSCKESWLLFFKEKTDRFSKGYEMKNAYTYYKKYCDEEGYNVLSNKNFGLRLGRVV
jgi:phage/plasmid-associated DNA primase